MAKNLHSRNRTKQQSDTQEFSSNQDKKYNDDQPTEKDHTSDKEDVFIHAAADDAITRKE